MLYILYILYYIYIYRLHNIYVYLVLVNFVRLLISGLKGNRQNFFSTQKSFYRLITVENSHALRFLCNLLAE